MFAKFIRNRSGVLLIIAGVLIGGFLQFFSLPVALYPRASKPELSVYVWPKGQTSASFRNQYGLDIEAALQGVRNVEKVQARYQPWMVEFTAEYDWGTDSDTAKSDARAALSGIESKFPREWQTAYRFDGTEGSTLYLMVSSDKLSEFEISKLVADPIRTTLSSIEGMQVPWVSTFDRKDVIVELKPERLSEFGLDPSQIREALLRREFDQSLGSIKYDESGDKQVTVSKKFRNLAEIANTLVRGGGSSRVYLRDVADIKREVKEAERLFKSNGKKGLIVGAATKPDANIVKATQEFLVKTRSLMASIDPELKVTVLLNPGSYIRNAVRNIFLSVFLGVLVSTLVLFLFFGAVRHTLVIGISIPLSLMGGFILMQVLGIEMNLVSLGAMALAAGMVVDGGVVVFENCIRLYEIHKPESYADAMKLVVQGMKEVRTPVVASVLTTSIVFAPLPFTSPIAAAILGDMAKVMVCVLAVSLLVALVILPALILYLSDDPAQMIPKPENSVLTAWFTRLVEVIQKLYEASLKVLFQSARWRWGVVTGVTAVFLASLFVMGFALESEIMPLPDSDQIFLNVRYKGQKFDLDTSEKIIDAQEARVQKLFGKYIDKTLSQVKERSGWVLSFLKNSGDSEEFKEKLENEFKNTPIIRFHTFPWVPSSLKIPDPPAVQINVNLASKAARLAMLEQLDEAVGDVGSRGNLEVEPPPRFSNTFDLKLKRNNLGLVSSDFARHFDENRIASTVRMALSESNIMDIELDGKSSSMFLRYPKKYIQSSQDIENMQLAFKGKFYALRHFADIKTKRLHREIVSENGSEIARLSVWPKQTYKGSRKDFQQEVYKKVAEQFEGAAAVTSKAPVIPGLTFSDADKEIRDNTYSLVRALVLALLLVLVLVCFQFGSLRKTFVVMLAIPFGTIGVAFSLYVFGIPLSVNSLLGLILLAGTAVNNSIVFVDFFDHLKLSEPETPIEQALLKTAQVRFRPIAITTLTTIFGMLPIAIGLGEGGEIMRPLGVAVCGGLLISTILTILLVPLALLFVERVSGETRHTAPAVFKGSGTGTLVSSLAATLPAVATLGLLLSSAGEAKPARAGFMVQSLNLTTVDRLVRERQSTFLNAELDHKIAKDEKYAAVGDFLPQVSLDLRRDFAELKSSSATYSSSRGVVVRQSLSGPFQQAWKVAGLAARQKVASLQKTQLQTDALLDARLGLFTYMQAQKLLGIEKQLLDTSKNYASIAKKRHNAGLMDLSAELRSKNQLLRAKTSYENAKLFVSEQKSRLAELLQTPLNPGMVVSQSWPKDLKVEKFSKKALEDLYRETLEGKQIPLGLARQSKKIQAAARNRAVRRLFPEIIAEYQFRERSGDGQSLTLKHEVQVGLEWNVLRGGKNFFETRAAVLQARKANNTLDQVEISYPLMVDILKLQLKQALARKKVSVAQAGGQRRILAQSQKKFDRGLIDALDLSQDIDSWVQTEKAVINSTIDALRAIADLCKLAGNEDLFYKLS